MKPQPLFAAALGVLALASCATAPAPLSSLPSDREVVAYVTANWDDYDGLYAYLSGREGYSSTLISVTGVQCAPYDGIAKCTFITRGRFEDGVVMSRPMNSLFQRQPDGTIAQMLEVVRG